MIPPEPEWSWYAKLTWIIITSVIVSPGIYYIATDGVEVFLQLYHLQFDRYDIKPTTEVSND